MLGLDSHPVLIAETEEQLAEARLRLARVGIEDVRGFLQGGVAAWSTAGYAAASLPQDLGPGAGTRLRQEDMRVLDVRREGEFHAGHIAGARWYALDNFKRALPELETDRPVAVHCKGGYRSVIACSLLKRAGYHK